MSYGPYCLYGLSVVSDWFLPFPVYPASRSPFLYLRKGTSAAFADVDRFSRVSPGSRWFSHEQLEDGRLFLRWTDLFEFLISADGSIIYGRALRSNTDEAFRVYLLNQVVSFALLRRGREPLHATSVAIDGKGVAFIGDSGYGKSTLGASFLAAGHRIITDDLLTHEILDGIPVVFPGPPQIKLFPHVAAFLLGPRTAAGIMTGVSNKLIIGLHEDEWMAAPTPLAAIYVIDSSSEDVAVQPLSPRQAFLRLVANTFNTVVAETERLRGQLEAFAGIAASIPLKSLTYPRELHKIGGVRDAVLSDMTSSSSPS